MIRGEVEREIQALVSKRDNVQTYHQYHAWDPVPSLSAASPGNAEFDNCLMAHLFSFIFMWNYYDYSRHTDKPWEAAPSDQHREGAGQHGLQTGSGMKWIMHTKFKLLVNQAIVCPPPPYENLAQSRLINLNGSSFSTEALKFINYLLFFFVKVSIHSVWLGNNINPLREEEWGEDEDDETDAPAATSPPLSPTNSRSDKFSPLFFALVTKHSREWCKYYIFQEASCRGGHSFLFPVSSGALQSVADPRLPQ